MNTLQTLPGTLAAAGSDMGHAPGSVSNDLAVMHLIAQLLATLSEQERELTVALREAERAKAHALTDALTGVGNRRRWDESLAAESARFDRYATPFAVVVVDIDGLKTVNDTQGHAAGDEMICLTATVLAASVRPSDVVARIGGDEFGILAVECGDAGAQALTIRLREAFGAAGMRASVGAAVARPGGNAAATWADADTAMYAAKRATWNGEPGR